MSIGPGFFQVIADTRVSSFLIIISSIIQQKPLKELLYDHIAAIIILSEVKVFLSYPNSANKSAEVHTTLAGFKIQK